MTGPNAPSEYGGHPGLIQPEPHQLTAAEAARLERAVDPGSEDDSIEAARERGGMALGGRSSQRPADGGPVPGGSAPV
jgi:hypothetical protein